MTGATKLTEAGQPGTPGIVLSTDGLGVILWAPRDASWYARPSTHGKPPRWHLAKNDGTPSCGRRALLDMEVADATAPHRNLRCLRCLALVTPNL